LQKRATHLRQVLRSGVRTTWQKAVRCQMSLRKKQHILYYRRTFPYIRKSWRLSTINMLS
jgi:hypothetical protein